MQKNKETLEEKIDRKIRACNPYRFKFDWMRWGNEPSIVEWKWDGNENQGKEEDYFPRAYIARKLIRKALLVECLTSPSEYVREYRKWYESRKENK